MRTSGVLQRRLIRTIPSPDAGFRELVERLLARWPATTTEALESRLRRLFPRAVVRLRDLSAETTAVWYVYRDGAWRPPADVPWWKVGPSARVAIDAEGWIVEANPMALGLLAIPDVAVEPRHITDFAVPGTLQDVTTLWEVIAGGADLTATLLLRSATGDAIACEMHAAGAGGQVLVEFLLADDIAITGAPSPAPATLACHPASDDAFRGHAELALARMPEPTAAGLAIRLRRLYPHARVEVGPDGWQVIRDGGEAVPVARPPQPEPDEPIGDRARQAPSVRPSHHAARTPTRRSARPPRR